jgi:hypothetical protein
MGKDRGEKGVCGGKNSAENIKKDRKQKEENGNDF